jgi:hypothetical protein
VLALKTKCLTKPADKQRVAHAMSLEECWIVLDEKYGDVETVVAETLSSWEGLKPKTDAEIVKFVQQEYSKSFVLKKNPDESRMQFLLSFLNLDKRA